MCPIEVPLNWFPRALVLGKGDGVVTEKRRDNSNTCQGVCIHVYVSIKSRVQLHVYSMPIL